MIQKVFKR